MSHNRVSLSVPSRRRSFATLVAAGVVLALSTATSFASERVTLRIGDQKGGNRALLEISGFAKDLPYDIKWSEFPAAAPVLEAMNAGALDMGYTGDMPFATSFSNGAQIKAVGAIVSAQHTQAVLVRNDSPIKSAEDLKGKKVGGGRGSWAHFLAFAVAEQAGYKTSDITLSSLGPVDAKTALVAGSIDAWATWEPYVSFAVLNDNARIVATGVGVAPSISFALATDKAIETKREAIADYVQRLNKARQWALSNVDAYAQTASELTKMPVDVLKRAYREQNAHPARIDADLLKDFQAAADRSHRYGIITKPIDVSKAVDTSFSTEAPAYLDARRGAQKK